MEFSNEREIKCMYPEFSKQSPETFARARHVGTEKGLIIRDNVN